MQLARDCVVLLLVHVSCLVMLFTSNHVPPACISVSAVWQVAAVSIYIALVSYLKHEVLGSVRLYSLASNEKWHFITL